MTTSRRTALGMMGAATSVVATAGLATALNGSPEPASVRTGSPSGRVPKGLRPGGELDRFIADMAARDAFSGSVLVTHRGRTTLAVSHGMADKERSLPNGPDTIFGLASVSKLFAAVAIAQLAQAGKIRYEGTIGQYLDGYPDDVANQVAIHHLLTNTSGLGNFFDDPGYQEQAPTWTSVGEQIEAVGVLVRNEELLFQPGAGKRYSNSGFFVLEEIVAAVSGQGYREYVGEHIFRPTGMRTAGFYTKPEWIEDRRIARPYYRPPGAEERVLGLDEERTFQSSAFATCAEMERFARALYQEKLLNPAYTWLTLGPKVPMGLGERQHGEQPPGGQEPPPGQQPPPSQVGFECYGPGATLAGDRWSYGHNGGSSGGASTLVEFYPDSEYVTVILSNYEINSIQGIPGLARKLIIEQG